eukprot:Sdes_comp20325_c0_seq8m14005
MTEQQLDCALDLMRRMPPQKIESNLAGLVELVPELCEDLLSSIDQPLKVATDSTGKSFLICDYNRDGDSYRYLTYIEFEFFTHPSLLSWSLICIADCRSPWTNEYSPPLPDGTVPSEKIRKLEVQANDAFDTYRELYFEGGVSSVYLWDLDIGFAGVILIKKNMNGEGTKGCWDSIHVVEVQDGGRNAHYRLTSTFMLWMETTSGETLVHLGGSLTRQVGLILLLYGRAYFV